MHVQDQLARLEITAREIVPSGRPDAGDLRLVVEVEVVSVPVDAAVSEFRGRNPSVWISRGDWNEFLAALRRLERSRRGEARLVSMSPTDLELRIRATDHAGHIELSGSVGACIVAGNESLQARVPFLVDLDPGRLPRLVGELERLAASDGTDHG